MSLRHSMRVEKSPSERRLETRFRVCEPVTVTLLDDSGQSWLGETVNVSASGLSLEIPILVELGAPVKVEVHDGMILGEVRYCRFKEDSPRPKYVVGLSIEHVLFGWIEFYERAKALEIVIDTSSMELPVNVSRRP